MIARAPVWLVVLTLVLAACASPSTGPLPDGAFVAVINASAAENRVWSNAYCSGVLIGPDVVATASHCVPDSQLPDVLVGARDLCLDLGIRRAVVDVMVGVGDLHQLALLLLDAPISVEPPAITIEDPAGVLTATGWGRTTTDTGRPCRSKEMPLDLVPEAACDDVLAEADSDERQWGRVLCLAPASEANTCLGDSGGGVYSSVGGEFRVYGLTLGGSGCGPDDLGVYASGEDLVRLLAQVAAGT